MDEQVDPAAKAEAARAREDEARRKARKNTIYIGAGMFLAVFALLSYQYATGNDPSLRDADRTAQTQAEQPAQQTPDETQQYVAPQAGDSWGDDSWGDDGGSGAQQQAPDQSSQSQGQSGPLSSGAS